jgi:hypothetical protein
MRYILLIYKDENLWEEMSEQEKGAIFQQAVEFSEGLRKSGVYQAGDPLQPTSTATTVRMKNGKTVMTDGPFAETDDYFVDPMEPYLRPKVSDCSCGSGEDHS